MDQNMTLEKRIAAELYSYQGRMSVFVDDLRGSTVEIGADEEFETASTIKAFILAVLYLQASRGRADLEEEITYEASQFVDGSGMLRALGVGAKLKVKDTATMMIICSDNIATNMIIDYLGLDTINACGLDGFVPLPFFLSNLENEMAKLRTEFGNIGNVDGTSVLNGMRLLCAEDNPLNAEILEELLHMQGATCTIYSDGKQLVEAFDHVRPSDYDVILMDVQMPVMNGYEATRALRASDNPVGRTIPIIAMTANAFADDIQQSLDAGMDMHLSKPIDIAVLEKTLSLFRTDKKNHGRAVFKRRVMEMEK